MAEEDAEDDHREDGEEFALRRLDALIESVGARVLRLPPYSPDFNPIEMAISKIKSVLRKLARRTVDKLLTAIGDAVASITAADAIGFMRHCGYPAKVG